MMKLQGSGGFLVMSGFGLAACVGSIWALNRRKCRQSSKKSTSCVYVWFKSHFMGKSKCTVPCSRTTGDECSSNLMMTMNSNDWLLKLEQDFYLSTQRLRSLVKTFMEEMRRGLDKEGQSMKMLPSFLDRLPSGKEVGSFLAVDLGGSFFRVIELILDGHGKIYEKHTRHEVPDDIKTGKGEDLFEYMAKAIESFLLSQHGDTKKKYVMGFTFSFPIDQTSINQGRLIHWNKGYSIDSVVGHNVVNLLQKAIEKRNLDITIAALANDTVGTMMAHSYEHSPCVAGVILGTGTNAAYIENISDVKKWKGKPTPTGKMIINMEWGNFDSDRKHLPFTKYDEELDMNTPNKGIQSFEKMISGLYLGELVRLIVVDFTRRGLLLGGRVTYTMEQPFGFDTKYMSDIDNDQTPFLETSRQIIQDQWSVEASFEDCCRIRRICKMVSTRSACLSSVGIGGIITKLNAWSGCTVAVDGSVFKHYPGFAQIIHEKLRDLFGMLADNVQLVLAKDGSGMGAALCAAISHV